VTVTTRRGTLNVAGRTIAYSASGPGDGAAVCIHGFGSDRSVWSFNVPALVTERTVYALDLPGHGLSQPALESGGLDELVAIVNGFFAGLGLSHVQLVGHSLGGAIAIRLAADHPELVAALTLVAPAGIDAPGAGVSMNMRFFEEFLAMPTAEEAQRVLAALVAKPSLINPDMAAGIWRHLTKPGVTETLTAIVDRALRRDLHDGALRETLLSLKLPVEIIWGTEDAIIPIASTDGLPSSLPIHRVPDAGHLVQMEKPAIANRVMTAQAARLT